MTPRQKMVDGLTDRARNLLRALDRQDRLETAQTFVGWVGSQIAAGQLPESTQELLLRALRTAGDPLNFSILTQLDPLEGIEVPALMLRLGLGRVAVSERVNDLVQAGLAGRDMVSDQIRGTALGTGIVALVRETADAAAERLSGELAEARGGEAGGNG